MVELRLGAWGAALQQSWPSLLVFGIVCVGLVFSTVLALKVDTSNTADGNRPRFDYILKALGLGILVLLVFAYLTKLNWLPRHSTVLLPPLAMALGYLVPAPPVAET